MGAENKIPWDTTPGAKMAFYMSCREFLKAVCLKLVERCPLKYTDLLGGSFLFIFYPG